MARFESHAQVPVHIRPFVANLTSPTQVQCEQSSTEQTERAGFGYVRRGGAATKREIINCEPGCSCPSTCKAVHGQRPRRLLGNEFLYPRALPLRRAA